MIPEHNQAAKKANTSPGKLTHAQCPGQEENNSVPIRAHLEYKVQEEMSPIGMVEEIGHGVLVRRGARAKSYLAICTSQADIWPRKHLILCDFKDQKLRNVCKVHGRQQRRNMGST